MDFTKLKTGDILKIKGKEYEIIGVMEDVECLPPKYEFRDMLTFSLLEKGSKRITPTHSMGYYFDTKEISFCGEKLEKKEIQLIL